MFDTNTIAAIATNENDVVVINDKQSEVATISVKANISTLNAALFRLERMSDERSSWEVNEFAASRKRLYALLTQCYDYYLTMKQDKDKAIRIQHKNALDKFNELRRLSFKKTTHDMNVVVSGIFADITRSRVSAYATALRQALISGAVNDKGEVQPVPAADLTSWIESFGGIEEVRTGGKNAGMTLKEQAEAAAKTLDDSNALGTISANFKTFRVDINDSDKQMLLVVTYRNTGQFEINALVKDQLAVNAALSCYYKNNKVKLSEEKQAETATQAL